MAKDDIGFTEFSMNDLMKNITPEIKRDMVEVSIDKVRAGATNKRQAVVDILNRLLGDDDSMTISVSKVIPLSGMSKNTFLKHLNSIRDVEFTIINKGYGTEIRRR